MGLQLGGILEEAPMAESIEAVVDEFLSAIRKIQPKGPYHLMGWSFGGTVAHCMACRLQAEGEEVALLAVLDTFPPGDLTEEDALNLDDQEFLEALAVEVNQQDPTAFAGRPLDFASVIEALRSQGHVFGAIEAGQAERMLRIMKRSALLHCRYQPGKFEGDLLLFAATEGRGEGPPFPDEWRPYIGGRIDVRKIDCRHAGMAEPVHLREIGRNLECRLRELTAGATAVDAQT
jgi:thioesterase domain-containing protein